MAATSVTPFSDQVEIATRQRAVGFSFDGLLLPNPDPILRSQGKSIQVYRDMRSYAPVGAGIRRRKAAVRALDSGLERGTASSRAFKAVENLLAKLPMDALVGQMMNAPMFGYQPLEVMWEQRGGLLWPARVQAKPAEWFAFDGANRLMFVSQGNPLGEPVPERKFLLPRQDASYENPYGEADLAMCFWPWVFARGGIKFWLNFAEKYGSVFGVGKLPANATNEEKDQLLDDLDAMIQNAVAVIPDNGSISLLEAAGKSASADLYERLVMHCRGEINIALLGQNQSTEASANLASSTSGREVARELRDADAKLVAEAINQLITWFCELNFDGDAPTWSLWDQASQDTLQAARDKSNHDSGARFTNAYFMRAYGYREGDLAQPAPAVGPVAGVAFAESVPTKAQTPPDALDALIAQEQAQWQPVMEPLVKPIQALLSDAAAKGLTAQQVLDLLPGLLPKLDTQPLADSLTRVAFAARLGAAAGIANE